MTLLLIFPYLVQGQQFQVKILTSESDLPENFCTLWEKGDYLVTDGKYLVLIGGGHRSLQSLLNYPAADAKGSIIGFTPAGKNLVGDTIIGSPYLRIGDKRKDINYSAVKPIPPKSAEGPLVIQATAFFLSEKPQFLN